MLFSLLALLLDPTLSLGCCWWSPPGMLARARPGDAVALSFAPLAVPEETCGPNDTDEDDEVDGRPECGCDVAEPARARGWSGGTGAPAVAAVN